VLCDRIACGRRLNISNEVVKMVALRSSGLSALLVAMSVVCLSADHTALADGLLQTIFLSQAPSPGGEGVFIGSGSPLSINNFGQVFFQADILQAPEEPLSPRLWRFDNGVVDPVIPPDLMDVIDFRISNIDDLLGLTALNEQQPVFLKAMGDFRGLGLEIGLWVINGQGRMGVVVSGDALPGVGEGWTSAY
jgi:hypothetical protein